MKVIYKTLPLLLLLTLLSGCKDFLGNVPKGYQIPTKVKEYELLLNDDNLVRLSGKDFDLMADEINVPVTLDENLYYQTTLRNMTPEWRRIYLYQAPFYGPDKSDVNYDAAYRRIFTYNSILTGLKTASGDEKEMAQVRAEALACRALEYLTLVGIYGPGYDSEHASEIKTIALLTDNDINHKDLSPASQQAVYRQILADLEEAIPLLPQKPVGNAYRMSKAAGYGIYARAAWQMKDYKTALVHARKALELNSELVDYKKLELHAEEWAPGARNNYPSPLLNPENILIRLLSPSEGFNVYALVSHSVLSLFDGTEDMRRKIFITDALDGDPNACPPGELIWEPAIYPNVGISTPEMYLIAAECEARVGSRDEALRLLNHLRDYRIVDNTPLRISDKTELIRAVLDERQREFLFRGFFRIVDLKRRAQDPDFAVTITHHDEQGNPVVASPSSPDYLRVPLPAKVLAFWEHQK